MAKDHGPGVKNDTQYEGLRRKGMSKERAIAATAPVRTRRRSSGSCSMRSSTAQGGPSARGGPAVTRARKSNA